MKLSRVIFTMSLLIVTAVAMGQDITKHVVQRGETKEDIAQMYGLTVKELMASNSDVAFFCTGLTLNIPVKNNLSTANISLSHAARETSLKRETSLFPLSTDNRNKNALFPILRNSVRYSDKKNADKFYNKAENAFEREKKMKYYLKAAQMGHYLSQVALGFYYGYGDFKITSIKFDAKTLSVSKGVYASYVNELLARYYLNAAIENKDNDSHFNAHLGLAMLSVDSISNKKVAEKLYLQLLYCAMSLEDYMDIKKDKDLRNWHFAEQVGLMLSTLSAKGIGTEKDLIFAYDMASFVENSINFPDSVASNEIQRELINSVDAMSYTESNRKYGVGLTSQVLLKKAVDIYSKHKNDREIRFWIERALHEDPTNANAYYFAGMLYLNGEAGLLKSKKAAKEWLTIASAKGSQASKDVLKVIEEIEKCEEKQMIAKREAWIVAQREARRRAEAEREVRKQRRRQMWGQVLGTVVQAAGNAYMYSKGYMPSNTGYAYANSELLNPNLAAAQVQSQYSQISTMQQMAVQNIQMPQMNNMGISSPNFTVDWNSVDWSKTNIDSYYMYQGDIINNNIGQGDTGSSVQMTPVSSNRSCPICHGIKKCWTCNGNRQYLNPMTNKYVICPNCTDGFCSHCHGTGLK